MEKKLQYERIIDAEKLLEIILKHKGQINETQVQLTLRLCGWKFQGTDGVRGIISTAKVGALDSLQLLINKNIITPAFCNLYAKAWGQMLKNYFSNVTIPSPLKIVFGEDGRDYYDNTGLKRSLIEGFTSIGLSVIDLGIVPTPAIAAFCFKNDLPGLMLTASHNPSEYNGIKLFLDGKKLYPDGFLGEYLLSWYIFSLAMKDHHIRGEKIGDAEVFSSVLIEKKDEIDKQILAGLSNSINADALSILKTIPIVLDTANGAYTQTSLSFFSQNEIEVIPVACNPGAKNINLNCGVGVLEYLDPVLIDDEANPDIVKELFSKGRFSGLEKIFGIALDGDGDRGFLLEYHSGTDKVYIYDGDAIGYIIAAGLIKNNVIEESSNFEFVSTVESDFALTIALGDNLNMNNNITCVGDRWLVSDLSPEAPILVACERSGHVIIPTLLEVEESSKEVPSKLLYTGNGLRSVLMAISFLLGNSDKKEELAKFIFIPGFRSQKAIRNCDMDNFYRNSELWQKVEGVVHRACPII
ncbi:MAG: hypothetical protein PF693_03730 [Spirochaetia bacterium]|jgi:phosphoglucosamine mutase|nr:hypothetical protein [Spirochaetia bacterium]